MLLELVKAIVFSDSVCLEFLFVATLLCSPRPQVDEGVEGFTFRSGRTHRCTSSRLRWMLGQPPNMLLAVDSSSWYFCLLLHVLLVCAGFVPAP